MTCDRRSRGAGAKAALYLLSVLLLSWVAAARADTYLTISPIGDRLTVVTQGPLLPAVARFLPDAPGARLVLIAPYRDALQMQSYNGYRGTGSAAGIGFYVGGDMVDRTATAGFLGAFANIQLIVADAASGAIETRQSFAVGTTHSVTKSTDGSVWNAIPMSEKLPVLQSLVTSEVDRRLQLMLRSM